MNVSVPVAGACACLTAIVVAMASKNSGWGIATLGFFATIFNLLEAYFPQRKD